MIKKHRNIYLAIVIILVQIFTIKNYVYANSLSQSTFLSSDYLFTVTQSAAIYRNGKVSIKANSDVDIISNVICLPKTVVKNGYIYIVKSIGSSGFSSWISLTKVIIPNGITSIEAYAFSGCKNLNSIVIPDSVTSIAKNAFSNCSSNLTIYCSKKSAAYYYAIKYHINYELITYTDDYGIKSNNNKLILVGDSRTNNMHKWAETSVNTQFVAKPSQGYLWFVDEAIDQINAIAKSGDCIVIWLGVNDYNSTNLGGSSWNVYANKINSLAQNEWSDCKVYVASVGYIDRAKCIAYYGKDIRSNVTQIEFGNQINGIKEFNDKLKASLCSKVSWIDTASIIGIAANDVEDTPDSIWYTRGNGMKDGLHYGLLKTQQIYDYFVKTVMK